MARAEKINLPGSQCLKATVTVPVVDASTLAGTIGYCLGEGACIVFTLGKTKIGKFQNYSFSVHLKQKLQGFRRHVMNIN